MSQNQESNTWSATDAKDNQQEIAKMVSKMIQGYIFVNPFSNFRLIEILIVWYRILIKTRKHTFI